MAIKQKLPKVETGYELGADRYGYFSIIQPEERTINYIENPVFYTNDPYSSYVARGTIDTPCDYFYSYDNASGAPKDRAFSIYGAGAKITPTVTSSPSCTIFYSITLSAGTYTFSAYYSGGADHEFQLRVTNISQSVQYGKTSSNYGSGLNSFQRMSVTFTIPMDTSLLLSLTELADSFGNLSPFYTDMWQCEDKPYMTHHFIGHAHSWLHDNNPGAYSWLGVPYFSASVRTDKAFASGKIIDLSELGFILTGIAGLGINPMNVVVSPIASGGGVFDGVIDTSRTFTLIGRFYGKDLQDILTKRRNLYDLIRPDGRNTYDQPTTLMFRIWDCEKKNWTGQPLSIYCRYMSGLEGALDSETSEDITITFISEDPHIYSSYIQSYDIEPISLHQQLAADTTKISPIFMTRDADGVWEQLDMRLASPTGEGRFSDLCLVEDIVPDGTGGYYIYGTFDTVVFNGVATTVNKIFRYNKTTNTISAMGNIAKGVSGGKINRVIVIPNGDAFVVGSFSTAGDSSANSQCIAKYKPGSNTWHSVGADITPLNGVSEILDVEYADDDHIYVSGRFTDINGLGTGPTARMKVGDDENVWSELPISRAMSYSTYGIQLTRMFRTIKRIGYQSQKISGFISGHYLMTFTPPYTSGTVYWDGTETFYTNWRKVYRADSEYPDNPFLAAFRGVIDQSTGLFYFIDGNDGAIFQLQFVMPDHTTIIDPASYHSSAPNFTTVYTYPDRDTPSVYKRLRPPFTRKVITDWSHTATPDWQETPFSQLRFSQLKIINSRLTVSPNFGSGLDAYELDGSGTIPEHNYVPILWYLPLWKGTNAPWEHLDIFSANYAYSAAFDINFGTMNAIIAVNPGHVIVSKPGDNHINAITPVIKRVVNNGENTPMYFRITGPAALEKFVNITTDQAIYLDGHFVSTFGKAEIITIPAHGSDIGEYMQRHILDNSDINMRLVPGKNIIYCKMEGATQDTTVKLVFRERYASIEKAIEYIGG